MKMRLCQILIGVFSCWVMSARAQWITQTIPLSPGWNAVHLAVRPANPSPAQVFAGLNVESVWQWNRHFNPVQFIQNAEELKPADPDWLVWFPPPPPGRPEAGLTSLHAVTGGKCFLIKLAGNENVNWQVTGIPVVRGPEWVPESLNFVGFRVGDIAQSTFGAFFEGSPAHPGSPIYRLNPDGSWRQEADPSNARFGSNEAFWVQTRGASAFGGPLQVVLEQNDRMDFGTVLVEQRVRIKNVGARDRTVLVSMYPSSAAPVGFPSNAGKVPVWRWRAELSRQIYEWEEITETNRLGVLKPGEELFLRLAIRRDKLPTATLPSGVSEAQYQSFFQVEDSERRFVHLVPVTASYASASSRLALHQAQAADSVAKVRPGLWIGNVVIQKVSQPSAVADPDTPRATASEAHFRLIVHVDDRGQARLLQQVMLMVKPGRTDAQGNVIEPGEQVLVTDDGKVGSFSGSAVRDGQLTARRFSTVAFGFTKPLDMSGVFGSYTQPLVCSVTMDYEDPLNPFKHRYHPDHNNLTEDYKRVLPEGRESYTITREVSLNFEKQDPFGLNLPDYGTREIGGKYREQISGVHRRPIFVEGIFRLHNASSVAVLNGGLGL